MSLKTIPRCRWRSLGETRNHGGLAGEKDCSAPGIGKRHESEDDRYQFAINDNGGKEPRR